MSAPGYSPSTGIGSRVSSGGRTYQFQGNGQWLDVGPSGSTSTQKANYTPANARPTANQTTVTGGGSQQASQALNPSIPSGNDGVNQPNNDVQSREDAVRQGIESAANTSIAGYQNFLGEVESQQKGATDRTNETFGNIYSSLDAQKQANIDKLSGKKTQVEEGASRSVQDLQKNLANLLHTANIQFGGNTSAAKVMVPYAFNKLYGAQETSVDRQAKDQYFAIDQQINDTGVQYDEMVRQTNIDKQSALEEISTRYGNMILQVKDQINRGVPEWKQQQLLSLNQSLLDEARNTLKQVEAEFRQRQYDNEDWVKNRTSELNNYRLQMTGDLSQTANFIPQEIAVSKMTIPQLMSGNYPTPDDFYMSYPQLMQKKREQYFAE